MGPFLVWEMLSFQGQTVQSPRELLTSQQTLLGMKAGADELLRPFQPEKLWGPMKQKTPGSVSRKNGRLQSHLKLIYDNADDLNHKDILLQ